MSINFKVHRWITLNCNWLRHIPGAGRFVVWSYRPGWTLGNRLQRAWYNISDALMGVVITGPMLRAFSDAAKRGLFDD